MDAYFVDNDFSKWKERYDTSYKNINHSETWLTLISMYMLFDDQTNLSSEKIKIAFQSVLTESFKIRINPDEVQRVSLELVLKEIPSYKNFLYEKANIHNYHLYPDIFTEIEKRKIRKTESLEGNTHLDAQIIFTEQGRNKYLFIESKFMSDIDTKTTYNPFRNQIIRNIDAMIEFKDKNSSFEDFYFCLLTPKIFRNKEFGDVKKTKVEIPTHQYSRLYCYKMDEYRNPENLKRDLPHRRGELTDADWKLISDRIGWITFDDIYFYANKFNTMNKAYKDKMNEFFKARNLSEE